MSLPAYPKYKDSGVEWLGKVPEHWEVVQSRRIFSLRNQRGQESDRQLTASQTHGVIYQEDFVRLEGRRVVEVIKGMDILKHVEPNDFVISMRSFQGGIERCQLRGCISSAYVMLIPSEKIYGAFFGYLLKSSTYIQALQTTTNLVRDGQALRFENFTMVPLPVVPLHEQESIASFLDHETAKIDSLVEEQQRLIELLKEKRQAVISHAVTKGLNPKAKMKPSGIEWLGDVPEHWEVLPFKRVVLCIESGTSVNSSDIPASADEFGVLRTSCVYTGEFDVNENKTVVALEIDRVTCPLKRDALVVSRMNTPDLVGAAGLVEEEPPHNIFLPDRLWLVSLTDCVPKFVHFWTQSALYRDQVRCVCTGTSSSMTNLSQPDFGQFWFCCPPLNEQEQIARSLKVSLASLRVLSTEAQHAIDLLQERRSALISAAVTGQIDVRDH